MCIHRQKNLKEMLCASVADERGLTSIYSLLNILDLNVQSQRDL